MEQVFKNKVIVKVILEQFSLREAWKLRVISKLWKDVVYTLRTPEEWSVQLIKWDTWITWSPEPLISVGGTFYLHPEKHIRRLRRERRESLLEATKTLNLKFKSSGHPVGHYLLAPTLPPDRAD